MVSSTTQTLGTTTQTTETVGATTVDDVSVIPFIRESNIDFVSYNMRPNREIWYYFDDKEMSHFVSRPNIITVDARKNFKDMLFNSAREEIRVMNGKAKVLLTEISPTGNTILYVGPFQTPNTSIIAGRRVTGNVSGLIANVVTYEHSTGHIRAGSNTGNIRFSMDASTTDNIYQGRSLTIVTGNAVGQSANIVSYNGASRTAVVFPRFTRSPTRNDIYSIGDTRKKYIDSPSQRHYTTNRGLVAGTLHIPNPNANTMYSFRTGDRIFRILDNPQNQLLTEDGIKGYTTRADYRYTSFGLQQTETQVINRVTTGTVVNLTTTIYDPIAQSFAVDANRFKSGVFVPSIDLFFKNKGTDLPVTVQIRPMVEGYPSASQVLPYAEAVVFPEDVKVSDFPNTSNSVTATRFEFPSPVYLEPGKEFAFVIITNDYGYDLWVSEIGQRDITTGNRISIQPYGGSMFKSQSGRTFTALQGEDVMFVINKCKFNTSGSITFDEFKSANATVPSGANADTFTGNVAFDFFYYDSGYGELPKTRVDFQYRTTSNATKTLDTVYSDFTPFKNILMDERKTVFGPEYTDSFFVKTDLSTTDTDVSPVVYYLRQNMVAVQNKINNLELSNDSIIVTNAGSSYTNSTPITFSTSDSGVTANGRVIANGGGQIIRIELDAIGSGYSGNITATLGSPGSGGIITIPAETDASGGPALARYISKTVTLLDGFDSGDLKVYITALKPQTSSIHLYYKVRNSSDPESIDDKKWVKMTQKGNEFTYSKNGEAIEYEYIPSLTANSVAYTTSSATYKTFNEYKVKAVLASSSTLFQDVPILFDIRAIALPADRY